MKTPWFNITNQAGDVAEILVYDVIGCDVPAAQFVAQLKAITAPTINLHLNSPGGAVFDGFAIYNALKAHPSTINILIDGLAASIASVIACAGDTVSIAANGMMMVHNANGITMGDAGDMQETADLLNKLSANIANAYAEKTGMSAENWRALMDKESWFSADEAKALKLADNILGGGAEAAQPTAVAFAKKHFINIPRALQARWSFDSGSRHNSTPTDTVKERAAAHYDSGKVDKNRYPSKDRYINFVELQASGSLRVAGDTLPMPDLTISGNEIDAKANAMWASNENGCRQRYPGKGALIESFQRQANRAAERNRILPPGGKVVVNSSYRDYLATAPVARPTEMQMESESFEAWKKLTPQAQNAVPGGWFSFRNKWKDRAQAEYRAKIKAMIRN
jgi:ATP-dependent Clp endopeptidase proteolytic subunit ClpP